MGQQIEPDRLDRLPRNGAGWGLGSTVRLSLATGRSRRVAAAWIGTGDIELFFDEDRGYAEALRSAGVDCELVIVPGAPHAFESIGAGTELAKDYTAKAENWLRGRLTP